MVTRQQKLVDDEGFVHFFGVIAKVGHDHDKGFWLFRNPEDGELLRLRPQSVKGYALSQLLIAGKSQRCDDIARLQLGPRHAMIFLLEGAMSFDHLSQATVGDGYIDVPLVNLANRDITIRIVNGTQPNLVVTDSSGVPIR